MKPGRARNHLVPGRMAVYATPDRLPEAAERRAAWAEESVLTEQTEDSDDAVRDFDTAARVFSFSLHPRAGPRRRRKRKKRLEKKGPARSRWAARRVFLQRRAPGASRGFSLVPTAKRNHAMMSDYYFGLEFLKAYPDVYTTVFPWLSERIRFSAEARRGTFGARELARTVTNDFAIILRLNASQRACSQR